MRIPLLSISGPSGHLVPFFRRSLQALRPLLVLCIALVMHVVVHATNYTWTATAGSAWNNAANWSPNTGFPGPADNVTIVTAFGVPILDANRTINNLTMTSGALNLNTKTLTYTGAGTFNGGAVNNGTLVPSSAAGTTRFGGTTFTATIIGSVSVLQIAGGTFSSPVKLTKTGATGDVSAGTAIFNNTAEFILAAGELFVAETGSFQFNGDLILNNTTAGRLWFGNSGGTTSLATGHTVSIGTTGFTGGSLQFKNFTQVGATAQTLTLGTSAALYFGTGSTFNGAMTASAGSINLEGSTFNGTSKFTKTGTSTDSGNGGSTFNGSAEFVNANTGWMRLDYGVMDQFNGNLILNSTSTGTIAFGEGAGGANLASGRTITSGAAGFNTGTLRLRNFTQTGTTAQILNLGSAATLYLMTGCTFNASFSPMAGNLYLNGSTFNGPGYFLKSGTGTNNCTGGNVFNGLAQFSLTAAGTWSLDYTGVDAFNGDITLNSTTTGTFWFGQGTGSATLASGHTIAVGGVGFNTGVLHLRNFTQSGATAQTLALGTGAALLYEYGTTFNGPLTSSSGQFFLNGATFNNTASFTKTQNGTTDSSTGGNTFNATTDYINASTGAIWTASTFSDAYNGDLRVSNTSTGEIRFGYWTTTSTLASGRSVSVGALGFANGILGFYHFTQLGTATSVLSLGSNATVEFDQSNVFNGPIQATAGAVNLINTTFNGNSVFTKTGTLAEGFTGGCTFNGTAEFINTNTQWFRIDYASPDQFNGNLLVNSTSSGAISFGENTGTATLASGRTITVGATGFATGGLRLRNFTQAGTTAQAFTLGTGANLYFLTGTTFNGPLLASAGSHYLNGATFNGNSTFTKTGTTTDNCTGGNTFNGTAEFVLAGTGAWNMDYTGADAFNGNLLMNGTANATFGFGQGGGTATLASGKTIGVGATGYTTGVLRLKNFTQVGNASSSTITMPNASLYFETGSTFNGSITASAFNIYLNGSTFNAYAGITKSGTGTNNCTGGNTFNGTAEFTVTCSSAGMLSLANTGSDLFNGNLLVNSTSSGKLHFGDNAGTCVLASGRTVAVGATGFSGGELWFQNFTQLGATSQSLALGANGYMNFRPNSTWNGNVTASAGNMYIIGTTFNGTGLFTQTGGAAAGTGGGNTFNGNMELRSQGANAMSLGNSAADVFYGDAKFVRTGSGVLTIGSLYNCSFSRNVSTAGSTNTVFFGSGATRTIFNGNTVQQFSSDAAYPPSIANLSMTTSGDGKLDLLGSIMVNTDIAFTSGIIRPQAATSTSNGVLILANGITISDAADNASHVDGFVRKIGNAAFTFPTGNGGILAPISISAPGFATDHFTAKYVHVDPTPTYNTSLHDGSLQHISHCEYWIMDRTGGTSNIALTLSWENARSCGVTNLADLSVAHWNGSTWKDEGHGTVTGTTANGTIGSWAPVTYFSPFTLASFSVNNPLPIQLLSFTAVKEESAVRTEWVTATERNNARFDVERSADGYTFEPVGTLPGAGDSQAELHYALLDEKPLQGLSYYRLKQTDFDGVFTVSPVVPVYFGDALGQGLNVFPNPTEGEATLSIQAARQGLITLSVWNEQGQQVLDLSRTVAEGEVAVPLSLEGLAPGMYLVRMEAEGSHPSELRLIKR